MLCDWIVLCVSWQTLFKSFFSVFSVSAPKKRFVHFVNVQLCVSELQRFVKCMLEHWKTKLSALLVFFGGLHLLAFYIPAFYSACHSFSSISSHCMPNACWWKKQTECQSKLCPASMPSCRTGRKEKSNFSNVFLLFASVMFQSLRFVVKSILSFRTPCLSLFFPFHLAKGENLFWLRVILSQMHRTQENISNAKKIKWFFGMNEATYQIDGHVDIVDLLLFLLLLARTAAGWRLNRRCRRQFTVQRLRRAFRCERLGGRWRCGRFADGLLAAGCAFALWRMGLPWVTAIGWLITSLVRREDRKKCGAKRKEQIDRGRREEESKINVN